MSCASDHARSCTSAKRILLLAAACNPFKGSDFGVGWHRALETAKYFDTWVLCGAWDREDIYRYQKEHGKQPNLHFCFVEDHWFEQMLKSRRPLFYTNFLSYHLWHRRAYKYAVRLHEELKFSLAHQVSLVGYREPGFLWKLKVPFIWGPVGGTQNYPWRFLIKAGYCGALVEGCRSVANWLQLRLDPRVRQAAAKAAVFLAANSRVKRDFASVHGVEATVLLETGVYEVKPKAALDPKPHQPFRLLWSGEFKHHKALHLLLEALSHLPHGFHYELRILGKGPLKRRWQRLARRLGVESHCRWLGWLPYDKALSQYEWADVVVFTSLRDTSGNVVLEALGHGVPVICLDHQGVRDIVTPECGVKIPVTTPGTVIRGLGDAILFLAHDRERMRLLSKGALTRAQTYLWTRNGDQMAEIYHTVLEHWHALPR